MHSASRRSRSHTERVRLYEAQQKPNIFEALTANQLRSEHANHNPTTKTTTETNQTPNTNNHTNPQKKKCIAKHPQLQTKNKTKKNHKQEH
jgi:hypothetical protein